MNKMLVMLAFVFPAALFAEAGNEIVAKDSNGIVVEVKEKYGGTLIDTCTVVMLHNDQFILVHREGIAAWFPTSFHSVRVIERLSPVEKNVDIPKELDINATKQRYSILTNNKSGG